MNKISILARTQFGFKKEWRDVIDTKLDKGIYSDDFWEAMRSIIKYWKKFL